MQYIDLPPFAPILMESTRAIGYSLETAIADIIDNSIAAFASNIYIDFFPIGEEYISILDNGNGMDGKELTNAMQYGSKNPNEKRASNDLGRFGLGLKTASLSQGKCVCVISKNDGLIEGRKWDLDYISKSEKWSLGVLNNDEIIQMPQFEMLNSQESGTLVVWQNLDKLKIGEVSFELSMGRKMDEVRKFLSLVYHRYLSGEQGINKISITLNQKEIEPTDPFIIKKSTRPMDTEVFSIRGENVEIQPFILPHTSKLSKDELDSLGGKEGLRKKQGFYIYRNKRLLVWGTWFRMMRQAELSKLVRIRVDIPNTLDDLWTLDIKKSSAIPPAEVRNNLKVIIERVAEKSKRTWTFRGKKEIDDKIQHMWSRLRTRNGGYIYGVNREHPLVKEITIDYPELNSKLEVLLKQIEEGIPLNQIYVDITNDEKIENGSEPQIGDVIEKVKAILATVPGDRKKNMLQTLKTSEPFSYFSVEIDEAMEGEF